MKLNYYIVNPGGNTTAIIPGSFTEEIKIKINNCILKNEPTIEQVGFWTKPQNASADARLEMAGNEFCGNALRSLGALLFKFKKNKKNIFRIESSGIDSILNIKVSKNDSAIVFPLDKIQYKKNICIFPGITHILITKKLNKFEAKKLLKEKKLLSGASGVISYKKRNRRIYTISPIVWINSIKTLYMETSCASGSMALALMIFNILKIRNLKIKQPSNYSLYTTIDKNFIILRGPIIDIKKNFLILSNNTTQE